MTGPISSSRYMYLGISFGIKPAAPSKFTGHLLLIISLCLRHNPGDPCLPPVLQMSLPPTVLVTPAPRTIISILALPAAPGAKNRYVAGFSNVVPAGFCICFWSLPRHLGYTSPPGADAFWYYLGMAYILFLAALICVNIKHMSRAHADPIGGEDEPAV
ncbi:hypothetical protein BU25DRAFT_274681 [Macroventuria anomochaeta]|uniref:Uncharacterized protein n=1 Tax=Macroventuria anomochaeta TaxID=301207 RepID=A0ACB6S769_9PLEO|nr:uncharacterized protein BU25DRAFT_274681 [Macroventuria anomochaeta]KAF2629818.1 hypothetical protein BU25DRAFT_274681 [Macroventuria anomochaeta]